MNDKIHLMEEHMPRPKVLERLIPPEQVAIDYIHRNVHGHEDFQMLDYARMEGINILLEGPTGPGKTMLCRAYCSARKIPCVIITAHSAGEPTQLFGKYLLIGGETVWIDGILTTAVRHGDLLVLFDEINFYPQGVTANIHPLTDDQRHIVLYDHLVEHETDDGITVGMPEIVPCADDTLLVAAYNEGYRGTEELNEAFRNRFEIVVPWGYSEKVEEDLIASSTLRNIAKELRRMHDTGEINTPCSTNRLQFFERMVDDIGLESAILNFLAQFDKSERDAVRNTMTMNKDRLWNDYEKANNRDPNAGYFVTSE